MPSPRSIVACIASCLTASGSLLPAQVPVWTDLPRVDGSPPALGQSAYDTSRQRLVALTANAVVECDRASFRTVGPGPNLNYSAVVYDEWRQVTVAFGGSGFFFVDATTRTWDGSTWTVAAPAVSPPGRQRAAMAFDRLRGRIVLFGGRDAVNAALGDTWEYDGVTWTQVASSGPPPRSNHAMAFDPVRGVTVLYGGLAGSYLGDTWEWNGVAWAQSSSGPAASPAVLAYDEVRSRCVLLAYSPSPPTTSTWERVGTTWVQREVLSPMLVAQAGGAFDAVLGRVVTSGPDAQVIGAHPMWAWNGTTWTPVVENRTPPFVDGAALAPCALRQSTLRFGADQTVFAASDDTFEWRGGEWHHVPTATRPPALTDVALAAEPGGTVLLFGGRSALGVESGATWRFTGTDWQPLAPVTAPSPRSQHGMVFDSVRGRVVLFGGAAGATLLGDTWEWDGVAWTQRVPPQSPAARANPALAFDAASGSTLLFGGGRRSGPVLGDFWRWDGTTWQPITAAGAPAPRGRAQFSWDPVRQRAVLAAGFASQLLGLAPVTGTHEWDGTAWTSIAGAQPVVALQSLGSFDANAGRYVLHSTSLFTATTTWQLGAPTLASITPVGAPCGGAAGEPQLAAPTLPKTGNAWFALRVASLLPGAPALLGVGTAPAAVPLGSGCTLLVAAPEILAMAADTAGVARFALPLPNTPALHGATFWCQGAGIDPQGAFANLAVFTAGLEVTID